jgi:hypothetical protein
MLKNRSLLAKRPAKLLAYAGLLFDFAGSYPAAVYAGIQERKRLRAKSVRAAMRKDVAAIAKDLHKALDK